MNIAKQILKASLSRNVRRQLATCFHLYNSPPPPPKTLKLVQNLGLVKWRYANGQTEYGEGDGECRSGDRWQESTRGAFGGKYPVVNCVAVRLSNSA